MPRKLSYLGRFLSPENSFNLLNEINTMSDNITLNNNASIKPIIYYNGRFHFVEEDTATKFHFDTDYALFQIYNFKVCLKFMRKDQKKRETFPALKENIVFNFRFFYRYLLLSIRVQNKILFKPLQIL
jgi:hypothetical protein